jgi:hypothetical protein
LQAIAAGHGRDPAFFNDKFNKPMALLRGNFIPKGLWIAGIKILEFQSIPIMDV